MSDHEYFGVRRLIYGDEESEYSGATFIPVCSKCGRFVKADPMITFTDGTVKPGDNATCKKCGRTEMIFEGFHTCELTA